MEEILHQLKYNGNAYIYIVSFLDGLFSGAMLNLGRIYIYICVNIYIYMCVCVCALPEADIFAPEKMVS